MTQSDRSKPALLAAIQAERTLLENLLATLTPAQWVQSGVVGQWSVKDVLVHLTLWERRLIQRSHKQVLALVNRLTEAEVTLWWQAFAFNTYTHYRWARTHIRKSFFTKPRRSAKT